MTDAPAAPSNLDHSELRDAWPLLLAEERAEAIAAIPRETAEELFLTLDAREQLEVLSFIPASSRRSWLRLLAPDDAADLIQELPADERERVLDLLDDATRKEVHALLAYAEDQAGGLMNPRYARLRPEMTVYEAISYLRRQTLDQAETIYYAYVLDAAQHLLGVVSFRQLFRADPGKRVSDIMTTSLVTIRDDVDQETVGRTFAQADLLALPVVDADGRMKGIVTADDIVDVVREEATEDMQKIGGMEALDAPYLEIGFWRMIKKRGGWLAALFLGEMLTATAMRHYESELARALVLASFVPLIISSGGNAGSQASTLVVRAMGLGEVRPNDWRRVFRRELLSGLALGTLLALLGLVRVIVWQSVGHMYGPHYLLIALTVAASVVGVVLWGTITGSMLPMMLRRLGFDPATASAPFVATLVDVTGLVIYFSVASALLSGTLL